MPRRSSVLLRPQHIVLLGVLLVPLSGLLGIMLGSADWAWLWSTPVGHQVLLELRLPRVLLAFVVGALLSIAGVLIQGAVRNPLAEPGLIGVSGGAAVAAAFVVVLFPSWGVEVNAFILGVSAFVGGLIALVVVMWLGMMGGSHARSVAFLILAGISINVLCGALLGLLLYMSSDSALRQISFWSLGSLGGASYSIALGLTVLLVAALIFWRRRTSALDALLLGETEARSLGVAVTRLQWLVVAWVALMVGLSVSVCGIIGFVGLVSPHIARLLTGAAHARVLPLAALIGGCLLVLADVFARTWLAPSELPVGIVTSLLGVPVFISLLLREKRRLLF